MLKNLERKSAMSDPDNVKTATESVGLVNHAASLQAIGLPGVSPISGLIGGLTYLGGLSAAGFVAASGGTLIAVASAGIVAGTLGVAICSVLAASLSEEHTKHVKEHLLHSGLLLWVRTWDREHERRAVEIQSKHGADDVHLHKIS